jgi:light-regulated signal transduction histidine kinase (bacteriophytochrome)
MPALLGTTLPDLLGPEKGEEILEALRNPFLDKNPLYVGSFAVGAEDGADRVFNAIGHRHQGSLILEFEAAIQDRSPSRIYTLW